MSLQIIIRGKNSYGKSRAESESNLRKDGFFGLSEENFDRAKYIEKRVGFKGFLPQSVIERTDMSDGSSSKE